MQTKHETLLVISIIDSFCAQLKLFCKTVILSEYFWTGTENTTLFNENCNVLENMRIYPKCVMYLPNCTIFSINQISFAENHSLMRSTKFEPISFLI